MKAKYEAAFARHVKAAVERAVAIGAKATWSTEKHLDALAEAIEGCGDAAERRDCIGECYNVSQFQQKLAKRFEGTGHFQREKGKDAKERVDDFLASIVAEAKATPQG